MKKSNISGNKLSELMADKEIRISGETIVAFSHKKERKSFFKKQVDVDEKKWDQLVEEEDYEWL
ncbi:MAG: hypothetical protein GYA60_09300 [Candidatus Methanofastidiosa archaeon]|nr:hypothetical protein [Candidatus Methanofastidiosa archaeon]